MSANKKSTAVRFNENKPQLSYILDAPNAMEGMVRVLEFGAIKYSRGNWKKGFPLSTVIDSMLRHLMKYQNGEDLDLNKDGKADKDHSGLPHVDHIMCNAMFLSELSKTNPELWDDRPKA